MAFGSMSPGMPAMTFPQMPQQQPGGLNMQALLQMLMQRGQQQQGQPQVAPAPGAPQPAMPDPSMPGIGKAGDAGAGDSSGMINRLLGMTQGTGMLNKLFAGAPGGTTPEIPPYQPNAPGPNQLTGMW